MSQGENEMVNRPQRVVILDADDPMVEVHGRFVWQEEHDRVVAEAQRAAFEEGYAAGRRDGSATQVPPPVIRVRRRRGAVGLLSLVVLVLLGLFVLLMLPIVLM